MAQDNPKTPQSAQPPQGQGAGPAQRTDYQLQARAVTNGDRRPVEVHQFSETMRHWREQSSQSKLLVS